MWKTWRPRWHAARVSLPIWSATMPDLVIRNAVLVRQASRPVSDETERADIAVEAGVITEIGEAIPGAAEEIDARGLTIFPAVLDCHVHFNEPGRTDWE